MYLFKNFLMLVMLFFLSIICVILFWNIVIVFCCEIVVVLVVSLLYLILLFFGDCVEWNFDSKFIIRRMFWFLYFVLFDVILFEEVLLIMLFWEVLWIVNFLCLLLFIWGWECCFCFLLKFVDNFFVSFLWIFVEGWIWEGLLIVY